MFVINEVLNEIKALGSIVIAASSTVYHREVREDIFDTPEISIPDCRDKFDKVKDVPHEEAQVLIDYVLCWICLGWVSDRRGYQVCPSCVDGGVSTLAVAEIGIGVIYC